MIDDLHTDRAPNQQLETISGDDPVVVHDVTPLTGEHHVEVTADKTGESEVDGSIDGSTGETVEPPAQPRKHRRRRKYIKRALLVVGVLLIPVAYSYARALTGPGNDSLQARTVEWARDNHLGGAVDRIEKYWYAHHQAKIGGTPSASAGQLGIESAAASPVPVNASPASAAPVVAAPDPTAPGGEPLNTVTAGAPASTATNGAAVSAAAPAKPAAAVTATTPTASVQTSSPRPLNPPVALVSPAANPLAKEGIWNGIGPEQAGKYGAYATVIRPDALHTSVLDAVVWIDPTVLSLRQYPGQKIPGAPWDRPDYVEPARQQNLVAAFEGGFRLNDSKGGMFLGGTELKPLRNGGATLVIDKNGVPNIGLWGRDFTTTDGLDSARQNLDLIVDGGVVSPQLATDANRTWGFTGPANKDAVWRSGAGITADGALVWVGGDGLSIVSLAETLVRAGAVRGMQLDINHEWVQFNTYAADSSGTVHGRRLLPAMQHSDDRYLSEDTRDFFAVFTRT